MDKLQQHKEKLKQAIIDRDNATGYRKKDLDRYVKRLQKEIYIYQQYMKKVNAEI